MTHPTDGNVTPIRPGMDLDVWEPTPVPDVIGTRTDDVMVYASIIDTPVIGARAEIMQWLDECRGGLELRWHKAKVHTARAPLYAGRASRHAPRGVWVSLKWWFSWVRDVEMLDIIYRVAVDNSLAGNVQQSAHAKARQDRKIRVRIRWGVSIAALIMAVLLYRYAWHHHLWLALLVGLAVVVGLGLVGAQRHEIVQFVDVPTHIMITADAVVRAFFKAKIAKDVDEPAKVIGVPHKDGPGTLIRCEVPEGTTFDDVLKNRDRLASALHCPKQCLELDDLPDESEGLLEVFIADQPPSKIPPPTWPLLMVDRWDIFRPLPVGVTPKGKPVCLSLMWVHTLIGAAPRRGKTTILRMIAIATLLDPRAKLIVVDFGGGPDYKPLRPYCLQFLHGPGEDKVREFLALLGWLNEEYDRRQAALDALPVSKCPEGRITPALAELDAFAPIGVVVDEFQVATNAGKLGEDVVKAWTALEKVCPKVGITITKATQAADDSVPTELRNCSLQRVALSMASFQGSMAILGNTAQKLGYDASTLGGLPGLAYSWGTDSGDIDGYRGKVRFANVTPADAAALMERIARVRKPVTVVTATQDIPGAGTAPAEVPAIIRDALKHWPRDLVPFPANCHQDLLAERMHIDQADLGRAMRKLGIPAEPLRMKRPDGGPDVGRGYRLADLEALAR